MYTVKWGDVELSTDDLLIEDLESVEKSTGTPWSIINPFREIKVARALLAVALLRAGKSDDEVAEALATVTHGTLRTVFGHRPDADESQGGGAPLGRKSARTSRGSSPGRATRDGSHPIPADSESAMS